MTSGIRLGKNTREFFADAWSYKQRLDLRPPSRIVRTCLMRAYRRLVAIYLIQSESIRIVDGTNHIEAQVARLFSRLRRIERDELQKVVEPLGLYFETNHDHVHV